MNGRVDVLARSPAILRPWAGSSILKWTGFRGLAHPDLTPRNCSSGNVR